MNPKRLILSFVAAALLVPTLAGAQGKKTYMIYGVGTSSCGAFLESFQDTTQYVYMAWAQGYVTATEKTVLMFTAPNSWSVRHTDSAGKQAFLVAYCTANPTKQFDKAVEMLAEELLEKGKG